MVVRIKWINMQKILPTMSAILFSLNKCWWIVKNNRSMICCVYARIMVSLLPLLTYQIIDKSLSIPLCEMNMIFINIACWWKFQWNSKDIMVYWSLLLYCEWFNYIFFLNLIKHIHFPYELILAYSRVTVYYVHFICL